MTERCNILLATVSAVRRTTRRSLKRGCRETAQRIVRACESLLPASSHRYAVYYSLRSTPIRFDCRVTPSEDLPAHYERVSQFLPVACCQERACTETHQEMQEHRDMCGEVIYVNRHSHRSAEIATKGIQRKSEVLSKNRDCHQAYRCPISSGYST